MSPRERNAWIATVTTLAVWTYYFAHFWLDVASGTLDGWTVLTRFLVCLGLSLVAMIGLNVLAGTMSRRNIDRAPDEMERAIEGRADRIGFRLLEALVPAALIPCLLLTDRIAAAYPANPAGSTALICANGILMVVVLTELAREIVHIVSFRRAA
jgi:hypothetical protein